VARTGRPRGFEEEAVVRGAAELFWSRGYAGTSVQDFADSLALQRGSLYSLFGDKRGLFLRAMDVYVAGVLGALEVLEQPGPVLENVRRALVAAALPPPEGPHRGCMLGNTAVELAGSDEEVRRALGAAFQRTEDAFRRALVRAQENGEIPEGDVADQAALLLVVLQGLHILARTQPDPDRVAGAVDAAVRGLGAPSRPSGPAGRASRARGTRAR
jgi:TetR/AcrR family transcriptional repressor of nem operon